MLDLLIFGNETATLDEDGNCVDCRKFAPSYNFTYKKMISLGTYQKKRSPQEIGIKLEFFMLFRFCRKFRRLAPLLILSLLQKQLIRNLVGPRMHW